MDWYVVLDGERSGPLDDAALRRMVLAGHVVRSTLVWRSGMPDWQSAEQATQLFQPPPVTPGVA
ncbi:MAG: DUF4339 domain-containing protein, partial [Polyangiaceae bacterium]